MRLQVGVADALVDVEVGDLDEHLTRIEGELTEPVLVTLTSGDATLHIGLGNRDHSVALFHDHAGRSWASRGDEIDVDLVFRKGERRYEFYASVAIALGQARRAAGEFAVSGRLPTSSTAWEREPDRT
ncbi:MAG: Imm1 family immunity protein [Acidimicrobiia bacterium]